MVKVVKAQVGEEWYRWWCRWGRWCGAGVGGVPGQHWWQRPAAATLSSGRNARTRRRSTPPRCSASHISADAGATSVHSEDYVRGLECITHADIGSQPVQWTACQHLPRGGRQGRQTRPCRRLLRWPGHRANGLHKAASEGHSGGQLMCAMYVCVCVSTYVCECMNV